MKWVTVMFGHLLDTRSMTLVDEQSVALETTIADLRRVSSELQDTNAALTTRVARIKKESDDRHS